MPSANASAPIATAHVARRVARPPIPVATRARTNATGMSRSGRYAIPMALTKIAAAARKPATVSAGRDRSYEVELTCGRARGADVRTSWSDGHEVRPASADAAAATGT